jgi:hypothetical protein
VPQFGMSGGGFSHVRLLTVRSMTKETRDFCAIWNTRNSYAHKVLKSSGIKLTTTITG